MSWERAGGGWGPRRLNTPIRACRGKHEWSAAGFSLSPGDGGPKPSKGLGSHPDLELLLRSGQPEEDDNEEEEAYFVAQGQQ